MTPRTGASALHCHPFCPPSRVVRRVEWRTPKATYEVDVTEGPNPVTGRPTWWLFWLVRHHDDFIGLNDFWHGFDSAEKAFAAADDFIERRQPQDRTVTWGDGTDAEQAAAMMREHCPAWREEP